MEVADSPAWSGGEDGRLMGDLDRSPENTAGLHVDDRADMLHIEYLGL